jgi:hypothetical protein
LTPLSGPARQKGTSFSPFRIALASSEPYIKTEEPLVGLGLAVAIQIEADQAEMQRQLDIC